MRSLLRKVRRGLVRGGKRAGTLLVALTTVFWSVGISAGVFVPQAAQAAVIDVTVSQMPTPLGVGGLPPTGLSVPVFAFNLSANTISAELDGVRLFLEDVNGTGLTGSDFAQMNLWHDSNGNDLFDPSLDTPLANSGYGCSVSDFTNEVAPGVYRSVTILSTDCTLPDGDGSLHHTLDTVGQTFFVTIAANSSWGTNVNDQVNIIMTSNQNDWGVPGSIFTNDLEAGDELPDNTAGFYIEGPLGRLASACNNDNTADGIAPWNEGTGEACDGTDLRSMTCSTLPMASFTGGTLGCNLNCTFDTSACTGGSSVSCGNGTIEYSYGEVCDGVNLDGKSCTDFGFDGGTLACGQFCGWDFSNCTGAGSVCGNGTVEAGEQCDDHNTVNGDGCSSTCLFESSGTQCFTIQSEATCNTTPGCGWDIQQEFCTATVSPCNNYTTSSGCISDPGCFWDPVANSGAGMCVMNMMGNYPNMTDDLIYTFPQPFSNPTHPLTDGDPYSLDNRIPMMIDMVPRSWDLNMAPLIVGFSEAPAIASASTLDGKVKLYRYDDLTQSWLDITSNLEFGAAPTGNEYVGTTINPLDPYVIHRIAVKGVTKQSGGALFDGQVNDCPDGTADSCWTATFKTNDSLTPGGDYQINSNCPDYADQGACEADAACFWDAGASACVSAFSQFGCQAGDTLVPMWPFQGATGVEPFLFSVLESCVSGLDTSSATASYSQIDAVGGSLVGGGFSMPARIINRTDKIEIELDQPLPPLMPLRLAVQNVDNGGSPISLNVDFVTGDFGDMPGGMTMGEGKLTIHMVDETSSPVTAPGTGAAFVVACGNLQMPEMNPADPFPAPPEDSFFMDGFIPSGNSSVVIQGIPTPSDGTAFADPCLVFLRPDTQGLVMGAEWGSVLPSSTPYSMNTDGTLPMPPMYEYASISFGDDDDSDPNNAGPNVKTAYMEVMGVIPGSLSGTVCLDDNPESGDADTCGAGDTKLSDLEVNVFPMGPMAGPGSELMAMTAGDGSYSFPSLSGGQHILQIWGDPGGSQNYNYFGQVTVSGATAKDIVIGLGNTLQLRLNNGAGCWQMAAGPVRYSFWPTTWGFDSQPVFGQKASGEFTDLGGGYWQADILGFGSGTYEGLVEVPGCKAHRITSGGPVNFGGGSPQLYVIGMSGGYTMTGTIVDGSGPVPNFNFGLHTQFDPANPMDFGGYVDGVTDGSGNFSLTGLDVGNWVFETFDGGTAAGSSFLPDTPADARWNEDGSFAVDGHETGVQLTMRQDKRVNILVTDGLNPVPDAMIDINCGSKYVHLGHSDNVWTFLPPDTDCSFDVWPRYGDFQPITGQAVHINADATVPQDVTLGLQGINTGLGLYAGSSFRADKNSTYPSGDITYVGKIRAYSPNDLAGHSVIFTYPANAVSSLNSRPSAGSCTDDGAGTVTCDIPGGHIDSFFDVFFDIEVDSSYTSKSLSTALTVNSTPVEIGRIYTEVTQLTANVPKLVGVNEAFNVFGTAYPNASLTLSRIAGGTETVVATTVMEPGSTWYSFPNVQIATAGDWTLKVKAVAAGTSTSVNKTVTVGGSTPKITSRGVSVDGNQWPVNSLTGLPTGQIFEGQSFQLGLTFSGSVSNVRGTFLGQTLAFTNTPDSFSWVASVPSGWTGYGNVNVDIKADYSSSTVDYGPMAEILVLIDPSGYVYDTADSNRISGVTTSVYQLVETSSGDAVTIVQGADDGTGGSTASNGEIEDGEELANSGSVLKLDNGGTIDCDSNDDGTLDSCSWVLWDASPSGQVNPQTTDEEGKYGWNVPQGWYRVSFQKSGQYSLSYSRDVYVPPAETTLNLNLGAYDIAAPTVSAVNPANGSTGVARNVQPLITFNEPMLVSTITGNNVKLLSGGSSVNASVAYNASNYTVKIMPAANLAASTSYTVRVTTGVKDDTSNALASTYESTFTTAAVADSTAPVSSASLASGTYSSAQTVSLSATDSGAPCTNCTIYYTLDGTDPTLSSSVYGSALTISATRTLKFFARDAAGNSETPVNSRTYTITQQMPAIPNGVIAGAMVSAVSLTWNDVANATSYKVYRTETSGSGYTLVASPTSSLYADYGRTVGTTYYYKVSAVNGVGESGLSAEVSATPIAGGGGGGGSAYVQPQASLIAPNGGQSLSPGSLYSITWNAVGSSVSGVRIMLSTDGGATYGTEIVAMATGNTYGWTVPDYDTDSARIKVEAIGTSGGTTLASDASDADFSILGTQTAPETPTDSEQTVGQAVSAAVAAALSQAEKDAPYADPNVKGAYVSSAARAATPSIDLDKGLLETVENTVCAAGELIKIAGNSAVYYCGRDGKRYVFPNSKVYHTWFADFSSVRTVTAAELASLTIGGNVTHKPGVRMVKITTDPKTYAIARGGKLRWVQTEAVAKALYGDDWNKKIDDVSDAFFVNYVTGDPITSADVGL